MAGALVAVGLLVLTMLVLGARPAEAVEAGAAFNVTDNTTDDFSPSYSPSGDKIAYRVGPRRSNGVRIPNDIYTINADGTGMVNLTNNEMGERDPYYSPDGKRIAYAGYDGQDWEIYIMNANGGGKTRLTNDTVSELEISWSPDGSKIAYERHEKGQDKEIYTIGLGPAHKVVPVTHNAKNDTDPTFSPSSQKIAYAHDDGHDKEIYTIKADGAGRGTQLTNNTVDDTELCWSPEGTKIAYKATEVAHTASGDVERDLHHRYRSAA
jgi:Tol biopolymer transport system component